MGGRGTEVAREASAIVLLDDDFSSIVTTIRLGRRIYDNLRKAIEYIVAVHIPIAGLALLPLLLGLPLMLTPIHIAFLEMIIYLTGAHQHGFDLGESIFQIVADRGNHQTESFPLDTAGWRVDTAGSFGLLGSGTRSIPFRALTLGRYWRMRRGRCLELGPVGVTQVLVVSQKG
jgi:hypothetical protein